MSSAIVSENVPFRIEFRALSGSRASRGALGAGGYSRADTIA